MGLFDIFIIKPSNEKLTKKLINFVYNSIQTEEGVRVEDAICLISTIVAERCIDSTNEYSINEHEFEPGSYVFSEKINELLVGPISTENWNELPKICVFGTIRSKIKSQFDDNSFPSLTSIFKSFAQNVGKSEWGNMTLSIPDDNKPFLLPLRIGYESRKQVEKILNIEDKDKCLQISIEALTKILIETKNAIDSSVALSLTFELINGMSKTATMTDRKIEELKNQINE